MGIIFGTYDTIAVAGPLMVWWERRVASAEKAAVTKQRESGPGGARNTSRTERARNGVGKPSRVA